MAVLLSALVLPGAGQYWLGHKLRACLFMAVPIATLVLAFGPVQAAAARIVEQVLTGALAPDLDLMRARIAADPSLHTPLLNACLWLAALCWVASIADAYWLARPRP